MRLTGLLAISLSLTFAGIPQANAAGPDFDARVRKAAEAVMREHGIAGLAIGVTDHGEQRFYNFGVASKATRLPVTSDTLFEIGSVSKTFTATLAAFAQAAGKLSLSESPARYMPELRGSALDKVTLINLATHTAGGFPLQLPDTLETPAQLTGYYKAWQPQYPAGSQRSYANPSVGLLGIATARALGIPFKTAMQRNVFAPMGLSNTHIDVPVTRQGYYAQGYDKDDAPVRVNPGVVADEAYGVKTSSRDLLRFVQAQLGQVRLGAKLQAALDATRTGYYKVGPMTQDLIWEQYAYPPRLQDLQEYNGGRMIQQSQAVTAIVPPLPPQQNVWLNKTGATAGFGAYVAFVPSQQRGIVLLANRNYPNEARVKLAYDILSRLD
ncbi:beta-lactamase [Pseudomonas sp. ZM23]|uniref:Beta-lactamase n=1 Tax=Pseudomonas triclosanedens TaxID=2961893 RepID=A0ABY6ZUF8_9PSED|nr:class C beta-lactamase [Pseudomonas triclosanedens]MCP8467034.1 beta-lactamase [Pseudomonas triclosanedens]MCP8472818.1 beta-lactamase [Pseudomonas triclosanedens]MCP8478249.1 beta-lactamase [Pseudomonas triclosanedens]WAI47655.1 beta-lactamase [Pseudomonas triclosanedens]